MDDDEKRALADLRRTIAETKKVLEKRGVPLDTLTFADASGEASIMDEQVGLVSFVAGLRGSLTRAECRRAAKAYKDIVSRMPNATVAVVLAGWDSEPDLEIFQVPEAAKFLRSWARFAGLTTLAAAMASPLHKHTVGLLAKCGCWPGEIDPDDVDVVSPFPQNSNARH